MSQIIKGETYGYQADVWERAKAEAIRVTVSKASPISYSELATHIRSITFDAHDNAFHHLLG
jgi:hypothetical protein